MALGGGELKLSYSMDLTNDYTDYKHGMSTLRFKKLGFNEVTTDAQKVTYTLMLTILLMNRKIFKLLYELHDLDV